MSNPVIEAENLTIRFNLSSEKVDNLKEYAIKFMKRELMFQEFLALNGVSFKINKGESVGLIGTNGSGKSTLLKTISGILKPYRGNVKVSGKIAPLIELGAGFDGNLTARENIFLNGMVLGHSREFMEKHFDEIVEFANISKFLDSPIKNFSSGMKARLGFAVATMVNPDILIVDEVLEVGDYQFRKRCNERMKEMRSGGTTLLFVSHNIESVKRLCSRVIWLDKGTIRMDGDAETVCEIYRQEQEEQAALKKKKRRARLRRKGMKYDYLIVGSGLFGAVCARELTKAGKRCLVIDKRDHVGGNIYTENDEGIQIHRYGAHIFHTSDEKVWKYVNNYVPFHPFVNSPIAVYGDEMYNLPFNMNTFHQLWGVRTPQEAKDKIAQQVAEYAGIEPANLEEQALSLVGKDIYEKLIKGYTEKQWGRDCRELPAFIIRRLPLRFTYNNNYFNDKYQGIPVGGYTRLIRLLLDDIDIKKNIEYKDYAAENPDMFDRVIYTGMIDEYFDYKLGHLEYRSLHFETESMPVEDYQGNAVVNYTQREVPYTRIIEHKHFMPRQNDADYTVITREYPQDWEPGKEPYYPVNDEKNGKLYEQYRELALQEEKVVFGGRLGLYQYFDMDKTIAEALRLVKEELAR